MWCVCSCCEEGKRDRDMGEKREMCRESKREGGEPVKNKRKEKNKEKEKEE